MRYTSKLVYGIYTTKDINYESAWDAELEVQE